MSEFVILIGGIIFLILIFNLRGRVHRLEQLASSSGLFERKTEPISQPQLQQVEASHLVTQPVAPQLNQPAITLTQTGPSLAEKFVEWLKEDWLLKLGAILLLIGFGWLTTYAFLNNWIGPMGRITLGIIAGALFILLGWWRIKNYVTQGGVFLVLGSTTILLTIFAARTIYGFFTPFSALIVMFLSTAFIAAASVKYNSRILSLLSLALAGVAPLLTKSPATDHIGLFAYLFVVILGAIWIVVLTGRRELTIAGLVIISAYSFPHLLLPFLFPKVDNNVLLLFAYAFAAVFFLTNTAGILKLRDKKIIPDLVAAAGNGIFLLFWIMVAAQDEWKSLIIAAWMVVFAIGSFLIFKITQRREPFYVYACVGIAMLAAATSAELKGATLTIAYTIESGIISLIAYLVLRDIKIAERASLLLVGPIILSIGSIVSRTWAKGVIHKDFFVLLVLGSMLLGLGLFFLRRIRGIGEKEPRQLNTILLVAGSIYLYELLWLSLHAGLRNDNTAVMISLAIYTVVGLISYFYGLTNERKGLRLYGGVLVGFVVGRLLLIDIWDMELAGRIITFFLIGALLVSTAFFGKKNKV